MKRLLIFLMFVFFAMPLRGGDVFVYVLCRAIDSNQVPGPMKFYAGTPVHADLIDQYIGQQVLPEFFQIVITDADSLEQIRDAYIIRWEQKVGYTQLGHDVPNDIYTLKIFTKPELVSASGLNRLTREKVESYLNMWGVDSGTVSISLGEVTFDASIYEAIKSEGFWNRNFSMFDWSEQYDTVTGIHRVSVDYSGYTVDQNEVASIIINHGCTIVGAITKNGATFDCDRTVIAEHFKKDVRMRTDGIYGIRRWRVTQAGIDLAVAAGGSIEVTKAQLLPYLHNLLDD